MKKIMLAAFVLLIPALLQSQSSSPPHTQSQRPHADVVFCHFEISRDLMRAYASFNVAYTFEVDAEGKVRKVTPALHDDWVGQVKVEKCLSAWRFRAVPEGTKGSVVFRWEHAKGWEWMDVSLPQFSQLVTIEGTRCPYTGCETSDRALAGDCLLGMSVAAQRVVSDASTVRVDVRLKGGATVYSINGRVVPRSKHLLSALGELQGQPAEQSVAVFLHSLNFRIRDVWQLGAIFGKVGYARERYYLPCERQNQPGWCELVINEPILPR